MSKPWESILARIEAWPDWAQQELAEIAREIDEDLSAGTYRVTREELRKIDEALAAVRRGEVASDDEVEAVFAKHRRGPVVSKGGRGRLGPPCHPL